MKYKFYLLKNDILLRWVDLLWFKNQSLVGNIFCHSGPGRLWRRLRRVNLSGIVPLSLINIPDSPE